MTHLARQQYALALLLLSLHGVMIWGFDTPLTQTLLLMHYGLFLLWQPVWRGEQKLTIFSAVLFIIGAGLLVVMVNWWVLALWSAGLFGLLGGRVFGAQAGYSRMTYMLAAGYLLGILLMWVVPNLLGTPPASGGVRFLVEYMLPLLPASLLFIPVNRAKESTAPVLDLFYSLLLFMLTVILILGSFAIQVSGRTDYVRTLIHMLFGLAAALVVLSWLWNPRAGFAGIGQLLSRYLLTIGMPFEDWLKKIAELANEQSSPSEFMVAAIGEVAALPWVSGGAWKIDDGKGEFGHPATHHASFRFNDFQLTLHTRWPLTPALMLHIKLLTLILGEFLEAKRREEALREQAYMRAVYETGSRMTHDIKNLVQSLSVLCAAAADGQKDSEALLMLMQRQLPQLNRRLALTLEKLQAPQAQGARMIRATTWWCELEQRHAGSNIVFTLHTVPSAAMANADMMDNVADNLLQNALEKARLEKTLHIAVTLRDENGLCLEISDDGKAIPEEVVQKLFRTHTPSDNGLGIGLYHAARQAAQDGYELKLANNTDGNVRFTLCRQDDPTS
ncbi:MAG TPA: ATP-binding protein [Methylophilaceae bacterium]|nr:ATP-binding protein [Methylophilaceae bacterium]